MHCPAKLKFFPVPQFIVRVVKVLFKSDLYISPLSSYIIVHIMIINFEGTLLFHDLDFMFQINNTVYSLNKNYTHSACNKKPRLQIAYFFIAPRPPLTSYFFFKYVLIYYLHSVCPGSFPIHSALLHFGRFIVVLKCFFSVIVVVVVVILIFWKLLGVTFSKCCCLEITKMTILVLDTTRIGVVFFRENYPFLRGFKLYHYLHEFSQVSPPKKKLQIVH